MDGRMFCGRSLADAALGALTALSMATGCSVATVAERPVTKGFNPAVSPDGRRIAFQRLEGDVFKLGVTDFRGGSVEWVEEGPGNAAYPEWTPSGGLVYMAGHDTETAYEAWRGGSKNGYGLRLWENGAKRDLTSGRCRDYTPCMTPDGKKVYFVTTRGVSSESAVYSKAASSRIAEIDLAGGGEPRIVMDSPNGNNSGFVQPAVSPDGSMLVWGHLESFFDTWRIYGTRTGRFGRLEWCPVSPRGLTALSPRWHPDGRIICFSGFRKGDPCWGVWVEDIVSGKVKRLADGENPCFVPGGDAIAYDRGGTVYVRPFGAADFPDESMPEVRDDDAPEKVLWKAENVAKETSVPVDGSGFAFGDDAIFFVRIKVRLGGSKELRQLLIGDYAEHELGFQLFASHALWFSTRDAAGRYLDVKRERRGEGRECVLTGIRTGQRMLLSVNGDVPAVSVPKARFLSLGHARRFVVGRGLKPGEEVLKVEVGTGWPANVPKSKKREDLLK